MSNFLSTALTLVLTFVLLTSLTSVYYPSYTYNYIPRTHSYLADAYDHIPDRYYDYYHNNYYNHYRYYYHNYYNNYFYRYPYYFTDDIYYPYSNYYLGWY